MTEDVQAVNQVFTESFNRLANTMAVALGQKTAAEVDHDPKLINLFRRLVVLEAQRCNLTADLIKFLNIMRLALGITDAYIHSGIQGVFDDPEKFKKFRLTPEDRKEDVARLVGIVATLAALYGKSPEPLRIVQTYLGGACSDFLVTFKQGETQSGTC
jgi:hypothetical protein